MGRRHRASSSSTTATTRTSRRCWASSACAAQPTRTWASACRRRLRGLRVRGHAARALLPAAQRRAPRVPPHGRRPRALQPRDRASCWRAARTARRSAPASTRGGYSRVVRRAPDRARRRPPSGRRTRRRCGASRSRFLAEFFANHGMLGVPRPPAVADRRRRLGALRRGADARRSPAASGCRRRSRRRRPLRRPRRGDAGRRRAGGLRRGRARVPRRPGAGDAHRPEPTARPRSSARSRTSATRRCCTPTSGCCPRRRAARQAWNFHLLARAQAADDRHLLDEPPAAPRRARRASASR